MVSRSLHQVPWMQHGWPIAAASLFTITVLGLLAQVVYALWLHATDPCEGHLYSLACRDKLHYFGSEQGEVIAASAVAGINVSICLAWAAHRISRLASSCRALASAGFGLWRLARELLVRTLRRAYILFADPEKDLDGRIRQEFERLRLRRLQSLVGTCLPFFVAAVLWNICRLFLLKLMDDSLRTSARELYWTFLFSSSAVPFLSVIAPFIIMDLFPSFATPRFIDGLHVLWSLAAGWKLTVAYTDAYAYHHHWLALVRMIQVYFQGSARLSTVLNVGMFVLECANAAVRPEVADIPRSSMMYRDLLVLLGFCAMASALERFQWAEARLLVQAKKSDRSLALVQELLSSMCDAVLQLDAHMCLAEPCPSLAALVFRGGPIPRGTCFADLISPEDSDRFRGCLAGPASKLPTQDAGRPGASAAAAGALEVFAGLCHLRLRVWNGLLPTSVFYSCVPDADGLPTFLLGIREDPDEGVVAATPAGPAQLLAALPEAAAVAAVDSEELSSSGWSSGTEDEGAEAEAELFVWVDVVDMRVLSCSPGFARLGGARGPCNSLSQWLSDSGTQQIWSVMDTVAQRAHVHLRPIDGASYACSVCLGPAGAEAPAVDDPVRLDFRVKGALAERRQERGRKGAMAAAMAANRVGPLRAIQARQQPRQQQ